MASSPLSFDLATASEVEPLDMSAVLQPGGPSSHPASSDSDAELRKARRNQWIKLALMAPLLAKAGPGATQGFFQGWNQAEQQRLGRDRQDNHDALARQREQRAADYQQQQLMLSAEGRRQAEAARVDASRRQLHNDVMNGVQRAQSPEEIRSMMALYAPQARALGVSLSDLDAYVMGTATPTVLQQRAAKSKLEEAQKTYGDQATAFSYVMPGEDQPVPYTELQRRAGAILDPLAPAPLSGSNLTEFESFYQREWLPAEMEKRQAAGITAPLTRRDRRDLTMAARRAWAAAGRDPSSGPSFSEQRTSRRDREDAVRARFRDSLEYPHAQAAGAIAALTAEMRKLGMDVDLEKRTIAGEIARDRAVMAQRQSGLDLVGTESPTVDEITAEFDRAVGQPGAATPRTPSAQPPVSTQPLRPGTYRFDPQTGRLVPK